MNFDYRIQKTEIRGNNVVYILVGGEKICVKLGDNTAIMFGATMTDSQQNYFLAKARLDFARVKCPATSSAVPF